MHRRHAVYRGSGDGQGIAPIQFADGTDSLGAQQPGYAERNNELGLPAIRQPSQSGKIQMIVVIVAEEHNIDAGKVLPSHARLAAAARTNPGKRTGPLRPDRIGQNVDAALLKQQRGVVDERYAQLMTFDARGRFRWLNVRNEAGGRFRPARELPSQDIEKTARLRRARVEEALLVEMLWKRR